MRVDAERLNRGDERLTVLLRMRRRELVGWDGF